MAVIADAFAGKLVDVLKDLITEEIVMILGVKDDLQRLQERLQMIKAVLSDAERFRIEDKTIDLWLSKLKDVMYDADDIIDLCGVRGRSLLQGESGELPGTSFSLVRTHRCRFPFFSSCFSIIRFRHEIGKEIKKLNKRLEDINKDRLMFTIQQHGGGGSQGMDVTQVNHVQNCPLPPSDFVGVKAEELARRLVDSLVKTEVESLLVFAIVGLGGIGKTTLAKKILNDQKVQGHFQGKYMVCVSQSYSAVELLKQMIRDIGCDYGQKNTTTELLPLLRSTLEGKRFLLVLDDVWTADVWIHLLRDPLKQAGESSSRVLITTRNEEVARTMGASNEIHQVEKLDAKDGWALLCKSVFENGGDEVIQNLREIGMQIVEKCDGLPLAIKAIAGVFTGDLEKRSRRSEWEKVYRSQAWSVGGELPKDVRGALYLSYEDLPSQLKQCFLFCSLFPEDYEYDRLNLIRCWIAEGFISAQGDSLFEDIAEGCYNSLISRNLLHSATSDGSRCTMHDLTRSLAVFLAGDESYLADQNECTVAKVSKLRRLAIEDTKDSAVVLKAIENPNCLRTLLAFEFEWIKYKDVLQRFTHLRILDLHRNGIGSILESIRNLHHLRYLNLDHTYVHELPESLGCLSNLRFLNLNYCVFLRTLPKCIVQLCNLRCLGLVGTPVGFVPSGIGQLRNLNVLRGFVVDEDGDNCDLRQGCRLDELQSMSQLRTLDVYRLERVHMAGVQPLNDKCHLKELALAWSYNVDQSLISPLSEEIFESLSPPPNLETFKITCFFGNRFPTWMCTLHNLTSLELSNCRSCQVLPPLGKLRALKVLVIHKASSVVTIGHEFLGLDTVDGDKEVLTAAFPKLEELSMIRMHAWEEWIIDVNEIDGGRGRTIELLPRLRKLELSECPKLRALPQGLQHAATLNDCRLFGNHSLREIENIPSLEELVVNDCQCLESISNLPALKKMTIGHLCHMLKSVEKVNTPQKLELWLISEDLPEWLLRLLQESKANGSLQTLYLRCFDKSLIMRCMEGGQYWPLLSHIPDLSAYHCRRWGSWQTFAIKCAISSP